MSFRLWEKRSLPERIKVINMMLLFTCFGIFGEPRRKDNSFTEVGSSRRKDGGKSR